jgi:ABC-type glutathione transport system ATPase component
MMPTETVPTTEVAPALAVESLSVSYAARRWRAPRVPVVRDVSFTIGVGETVALVGESGSGKSTIGNAVLGLVSPDSGTIRVDGRDVLQMRGGERRAMAVDLQAVFQNPYGSLNPSLSIGSTLAEPLRASGASKKEAHSRIRALLAQVNLPADAADRLPGAFSGGQRQRIAIARAVALRPRLIVCDEPTSALDVTTQAAVLTLLRELQCDLQVSYLFITHDLAVVRDFAHRACVLRGGEIVEDGPAEAVCESPKHPYTRKLLAAAPVPDPVLQRERRAAWQALEADDV